MSDKDDDETARKMEAMLRPRKRSVVAERIAAMTQNYQRFSLEQRIAEEKDRAARRAILSTERHGESAHEVAEEEEQEEVVLARTTNRRQDQDPST